MPVTAAPFSSVKLPLAKLVNVTLPVKVVPFSVRLLPAAPSTNPLPESNPTVSALTVTVPFTVTSFALVRLFFRFAFSSVNVPVVTVITLLIAARCSSSAPVPFSVTAPVVTVAPLVVLKSPVIEPLASAALFAVTSLSNAPLVRVNNSSAVTPPLTLTVLLPASTVTLVPCSFPVIEPLVSCTFAAFTSLTNAPSVRVNLPFVLIPPLTATVPLNISTFPSPVRLPVIVPPFSVAVVDTLTLLSSVPVVSSVNVSAVMADTDTFSVPVTRTSVPFSVPVIEPPFRIASGVEFTLPFSVPLSSVNDVVAVTPFVPSTFTTSVPVVPFTVTVPAVRFPPTGPLVSSALKALTLPVTVPLPTRVNLLLAATTDPTVTLAPTMTSAALVSFPVIVPAVRVREAGVVPVTVTSLSSDPVVFRVNVPALMLPDTVTSAVPVT